MSMSTSTSGLMSPSGQPGITLTPEETRMFGQLFKKHDTDGTGIILGDVARPLFEMTGLPAATLGQIWQLADSENRGFLDHAAFAKALRMIYHVQGGQPLSSRLSTIPSKLPRGLDGNPVQPQPQPQSQPQSVVSPVATGNSVTSSSTIPALTTADKQRFGALFDRSTDSATIEGEAAKDIFLKARLPNEVLGHIWGLVDVQGRGSLTKNEFVLAMHLIQCTMNRSLAKIPETLPSGWQPWLQGSLQGTPQGTPQGYIQGHSTGKGSISSLQALESVGTGSAPAVGGHPNTWQISSQQMKTYNGYFDGIDAKKSGKIGAAEVVPFLTKSRLSEEVLAQVWDLADLTGMGEFGRTEFALAVYLVQAILSGAKLPETLPEGLLRSAQQQQSQSQPQKQSQPQQSQQSQPQKQIVPQPTSSLTDLVGLDSFLKSPVQSQAQAPAAATTPAPISTNSAAPGLSSAPNSATMPSSAPRQVSQSSGQGFPGSKLKFTPSSNFGQSLLNKSTTSDSIVVNDKSIDNPDSAEKSQLQAKLETSTSDLQKGERELAESLENKAKAESQLADLRKRYDAEASRVHAQQTLLRETQEAIRRLEKDYTLRESSFRALQSQSETYTAKLEDAAKEKELQEQRTAQLEEQYQQHGKQVEQHEATLKELNDATNSHVSNHSALELKIQGLMSVISNHKNSLDESRQRESLLRERSLALQQNHESHQSQFESVQREVDELNASHAQLGAENEILEAKAAEAETQLLQISATKEQAIAELSKAQEVKANLEARLAEALQATAAAEKELSDINAKRDAILESNKSLESEVKAAEAETTEVQARSHAAAAEGKSRDISVEDSQPQEPEPESELNMPGAYNSTFTHPSQHQTDALAQAQAEAQAGMLSRNAKTLPIEVNPLESEDIEANPTMFSYGNTSVSVESTGSVVSAVEQISGSEDEPRGGILPVEESQETVGSSLSHSRTIDLPLERPQSASSSVINNAPQSVRGDLDVDSSRPQTPTLGSRDSFEFVDAEDGKSETFVVPPVPMIDQNAVHGKTASAIASAPSAIAEESSRFIPAFGERKSSLAAAAGEGSEISSTNYSHEAEDGYSSPSSFTTGPVPVPQAQTEANTSVRGDEFASAFDDLEPAPEDAEEDDEEALTGFGNSQPQPQQIQSQPAGSFSAANDSGPDEWRELFASPSAPSPAAPVAVASQTAAHPSSHPDVESLVLQLTAMGFGRDESYNALSRSNYSIEEAMDILME